MENKEQISPRGCLRILLGLLIIIPLIIYTCQRDEEMFMNAGGYNAEEKAVVTRVYFLNRQKRINVLFSSDGFEYEKGVQVFGNQKIEKGDTVLVRFNKENPTWKVMLSATYEELKDKIKDYHGPTFQE